MTRTPTLLSLTACAALLAACGPSEPPKADPLVKCMFQTDAPGQYQSPANGEMPVVTPVPGTGATQAGADAMNACIRSKMGMM